MGIVHRALVLSDADMVRNFVQHNRLAHSPRLIAGNRDNAVAVMGTGTSLAMPNLDLRQAEVSDDVGCVDLRVFEAAEPELHRGIDRGAEEVDSTTAIENRRPLIFGLIHGGSVQIACGRHEFGHTGCASASGRVMAPAAIAANIDAPSAPASSTSLTSK